jgi:hypothetical protein
MFIHKLKIMKINKELVKFGKPLGVTKQKVVSFSNHGKSKNKDQPNYYNNVYSGVKYQSVEFVRRWLITVYGITFESVDDATDIFKLKNFILVKYPSIKIVIEKCVNNGSKNIAFGNVIIWDSQGAFNVDGSCAIVVKVKNNIIYIADQNVSNKSWNDKCYSRKLYVNENNVIEDREYPDTKITGWLKYN